MITVKRVTQIETDEQEPVELTQPEPDTVVEPIKTPSWFEGVYETPDTEALVAQYRQRLLEVPPPAVSAAAHDSYEAYRQRIAARVSEAQMNVVRDQQPQYRQQPSPEAPVYAARRPTMQSHDVRARDQHYKKSNGEAPIRPTLSMAAITVLAIAMGGGIGYSFANPQKVQSLWQAGFTSVANLTKSAPIEKPLVVAETAGETIITKKPVSTASLAVADVSGLFNDPIPLLLRAEAADSSQPISLRVTGLPETAYLSAGVELSKGDWLLKAAEIPDVSLTVPTSDVESFALSVAAIETKTGLLAAPIKEMKVALINDALQITPANSPPALAQSTQTVEPAATPEISPQARNMIEKGEMLLKAGDLVAARPFFLQAHEMGLGLGAFGVGRTYDPATFAALNVQGLKPDAAKAVEWYEKAANAGVVEAQAALTGLPQN